MEPQIYLISLYLAVEEKFKKAIGDRCLRARGFEPALSDIELITIELFGEYQGYGNDKSIWRYIKEHWIEWFPQLGSYKNFTKHCANLMVVKEQIFTAMGKPKTGETYIVDGLPMPICNFTWWRTEQDMSGTYRTKYIENCSHTTSLCNSTDQQGSWKVETRVT